MEGLRRTENSKYALELRKRGGWSGNRKNTNLIIGI